MVFIVDGHAMIKKEKDTALWQLWLRRHSQYGKSAVHRMRIEIHTNG